MKPKANLRQADIPDVPILLWAIDAFGEMDEASHHAAAQTLQEWKRKTGGRVVPVSVLSNRQFGISLELEFDSIDVLRSETKRRLSALVKRLRIQGIDTPVVLVSPTMSRAQEAQLLSDYAVHEGADLILMNTHGRGGIRRALVGSFAEAALLRSRVPVMTLNPSAKSPSRLDHVLFPTEFGRYSLGVFRRVVAFAKTLGAELTLLHVLPTLWGRDLAVSAFGYPVPTPVLLEEEQQRKHRIEQRLAAWAEWAKHEGVPADFLVMQPGDSVAEVILSTAKKYGTDLIAIESESGWISAALLGSVSRNIIRHASSPVWSIRSRIAVAQRVRVPQEVRRRRAA